MKTTMGRQTKREEKETTMDRYQWTRWETSDWLLSNMSDDDNQERPELDPYDPYATDAEIDGIFDKLVNRSA